MDQIYVIRHKVITEGQSIRSVSQEMGVSRRTVERYVLGAEPGARKSVQRDSPVMTRVRPRLETLLRESPQWTAGKQRLTATRLHQLVRQEGYQAGLTLVKDFVREWKRQRREVFVPLVYLPGDLAEVDFFAVWVDLLGQRCQAWMFVLRLMYAPRDFAWIYAHQDQVSFLDGHVRAFTHFDGMSLRIAYDNLKPAVARVLVGSERELTRGFLSLVNHYLFEPCFARPGTGHDKGGVEARGKGIRWQHLVPIPTGTSLEEINQKLLERLDTQASTEKIVTRFAEEQLRMLPHPATKFHAAKTSFVTASRQSLVRVAGATYSVPERWAGLEITAHAAATEVTLVGPSGSIVKRRAARGERIVDYRHYLRELSRKPQALRQVAGDLIRDLGEPFATVWRSMVEDHGPKQAARLFAEVLRALETLGETVVVERLLGAIQRGEPLLLALRAETNRNELPALAIPESLRDVVVATANAADYDDLLVVVDEEQVP